jgi:signal peptidase II
MGSLVNASAHITKLKLLALVSGPILALDLATKAWVLANLPLGGGFTVIPGFFDITHVHNPGGAFGFLAGLGAEVRMLLFVAVALAAIALVLVFYWQTPTAERATAFGLALVLGGAVGNLVDRLRFGVVVDFLDVYAGELHWPAFNVADSAITVGVVLIAVRMLLQKEPPAECPKP